MIKSFGGRDPYGVKVGGYINLLAVARNDSSAQFSFRALEGPDKGKKVAEGDCATLINCTGFVRTATRERLVAAKANPGQGKGDKGFREVHAWIVGTLMFEDFITPEPNARRVTYRPFERGDFFYPDNGETFVRAEALTFDVDRGVYVVTL